MQTGKLLKLDEEKRKEGRKKVKKSGMNPSDLRI
jgi:hypothetical protein